MSSIDTVLDSTRELAKYTSQHPCALDHAREACWEALADLAATDLSRTGTRRQSPEFWLGHLEYLLGHLLVTMEQAES